jgi:hypothetical protein
MARPDLSVKDVERMGKEEPGSAARYLEERREELEAEQQAEREQQDKELYVENFVKAGGDKSAAEAAYKAHRNQQAAEAANRADTAAVVHTRRRIGQTL